MTNKEKNFIRRIKKIDPEAATYIKDTVFPSYIRNNAKPPLELDILFLWELTPQGCEYWSNIYLKMRKS